MTSRERPARSCAEVTWFWMPLAASWLLMCAEGPVLHAVIARLDDAATQLAAFGVALSLEVMIESPIIMLMATATALARNASAHRLLFRFMLHANLVLTLLAALLAFSPLFHVVVPGFMGIPPDVSAELRPGLKIMTLWSAAIGWRRFHQGLLIRAGHTRRVGYGTLLRLSTSAGTAAGLALTTPLSGVCVACSALMAGVLSEALLAWWLARPVVRRELYGETPDPRRVAAPLTYREVLRFHVPLAATSVLALLVQPVVSAGLARSPHPEQSLAAWPVVYGLLMIFKASGFALPETILAQTRRGTSAALLRAFSLRIALLVVGLLALVTLSPLLDLHLRALLGLEAPLVTFAREGVLFAVLLPGVHTLQNWLRGTLMAANRTGVIYRGMGLHLVLVSLGVAAGAMADWPGVPGAVLSLSLALAAEAIYLGRAIRRERRSQEAGSPEKTPESGLHGAARVTPAATSSAGRRGREHAGEGRSAGRADPG